MIRPGVFGEKHEGYFVAQDDCKFEVFKDEVILVFESEFTDSGFEIQINQRSYKIDAFEYSTVERKGVNKYSLKLGCLGSGIYQLRVNALHSGKRISVLRTQFAIDKKLYVEQVKNNNDSYIVSVDSDLMPEPIFDKISVQDFREDWIKFNWNNQEYIYYVPFRFPLYRIDNGAWKPFSQEIWIGDITQESSIDLYGCKYDKICLLMSQIDEEDVEAEFGEYNITKKDLETIMQVVFGVFKVTPAINSIKSTLTPDEKMEALEYRRFDNYVMFNCPKTINGVRSFLPVKGKDNMVVRYVQKVCECDEESAKALLEVVFNNLAVAGELFKKHETKECYQIEASKYVVKNYKTSKYYICSKCGRLTPYNVHNKCVQDKCDGILSEVDPDKALASNYYRRQYKTKKIESIVVKEHTAQLDRKKAKQYQQDFKSKKINILSCSTTFEMGIDIGDLETVFMRNVPPSPANYVQRAGRAGRRKDSAAYILTYCGTGSHDYTYFCSPEKMISGVIKPPYFNVVNHKIIVRHLMATCLGFFFRQHPDYFTSIDELVFGNALEEFKNYISSHPSDLNIYINEKILPGDTYRAYHNFKWFDEIEGNDEKMEHFVSTIKSIAEEYEKAKKEAITEENYKEADYYQRQIENLHKEKVIDSLSKYCVIPKYGFPVDVVELQIYKEGIMDNSYDLSRDLKIAISEYAPDSEIIVDGKKYTSKYISLPKTGEYPRNYFCTCPNCKKINVSVSTRTGNECKYCGEPLGAVVQEFYIEPINGFKTGITKESTRAKPKRSYAGEVSYLGGGIKDENIVSLSNAITIETSINDELLVMNKSSFNMCPICGYSDIVKGKVITPTSLKKHKNYRQFDCSCEELTQVRLGHRFQTDVARFTIPMLGSFTKEDYAIALSFMYAFLEGISIGLGIERNDIDGVLELNLEQHSYDILLYDNVPGGAGHVKRLVEKNAVITSLNAAYVKVSQQCCDENTSCYNCLRNYYNQTNHSKLKRKYARDFIESLLRQIGVRP